jgi:predicted MFS family arabinose efflux permease
VNLPIAAVVAFGAFTLLPKHTGHLRVRLDIPGVILGCGGLVALVFGLGEAGADGWSSRAVIGPLIGAGVLLGLFVVVQTKVSNPLLPLRIPASRNRGGAFLTIIFAVLGMYGTFLFLTYLLQTVDHYSPLKTGVAFLPLMAVNGLAATQLASRLMAFLPTRVLVVPGLLLAAIGVALLTQLTPGASYVAHVLPTELLLGLGLGIALVPCISTATNNAEPGDVGVTSATTNTSQQIGASIGTALLNTIAATASASYLATHVHSASVLGRATVHGFAVASAWATGSMVMGALVGGILINANPVRDRQRHEAAAAADMDDANAGVDVAAVGVASD